MDVTWDLSWKRDDRLRVGSTLQEMSSLFLSFLPSLEVLFFSSLWLTKYESGRRRCRYSRPDKQETECTDRVSWQASRSRRCGRTSLPKLHLVLKNLNEEHLPVLRRASRTNRTNQETTQDSSAADDEEEAWEGRYSHCMRFIFA